MLMWIIKFRQIGGMYLYRVWFNEIKVKTPQTVVFFSRWLGRF